MYLLLLQRDIFNILSSPEVVQFNHTTPHVVYCVNTTAYSYSIMESRETSHLEEDEPVHKFVHAVITPAVAKPTMQPIGG